MEKTTRVRIVAAAIVLVGFGAAAGIYRAAEPESEFELPETKQHLRQLEMYGGTANRVANDFNDWLASLWQGKRRATTVACLSLITAGIYMFFALPLLPLPGETERPRT